MLYSDRVIVVRGEMGTKIEYVDSSHMYATNYIRNSKAIAVLWAIFTICYTIISVVAFVTPGKMNLLTAEGNYNYLDPLIDLRLIAIDERITTNVGE